MAGSSGGTMSTDPWADAPVAVGHHRRRLGWGLVALILVVAVGLGALLTRSGPITAPPLPPAPAPTAPAAPRSVPFDVTVEITDVVTMDNDRLFGRDAEAADEAAETAVRAVEAVLQTYLDAEFVTPGSRFSDRPLRDLLSRRALTALQTEDLTGLGVLGLSVRQVVGEPVLATARVLTRGSDAAIVQIRYDAHARIMLHTGAPRPMRQNATMVFVPEDDQWRAQSVDVTLDIPPAPGEVPR
ncbi:MAG TPA: hypothetical protein VK891_16025 [Euzebyales bacterium]|nr:hypothetical protein [Euzebyales bacterium]